MAWTVSRIAPSHPSASATAFNLNNQTQAAAGSWSTAAFNSLARSSENMDQEFRYYMHDGPDAISFELAGHLSDRAARELEQARRTASSTARGRSLIVDLSYVTGVDTEGRAMLRGWHADGAQLVAKVPLARMILESITRQSAAPIVETARRQTWRPVLVASFLAIMSLFAPTPSHAAELSPETVQVWARYLKAVDARNQTHLAGGKPFLSVDAVPGQAARLKGGEIAVSRGEPTVPIKVPSGLIHDWTGAIFIPGVTLLDVLHVVRDYQQYKDIYRPNVVDSKAADTGGWQDRFSVVLMNKSLLAKAALDTDYRSSYTRVDDRRWYSVSETTRVREIAEFGSPSQRTLPEDQGTGLIWRLYSIARFEEREGGVYVEMEALALSRDIPSGLRWLVEPIVRRISRSSLATSLQQTEDAVLSGTTRERRFVNQPPCLRGANCSDLTRLSAVCTAKAKLLIDSCSPVARLEMFRLP
jgi:ABC-type transporter Mla MlaB component